MLPATIGKTATTLLKNKYFWLAIIIIVSIFILRKNLNVWGGKIRAFFKPAAGDYSHILTILDKTRCEKLASELYTDIYGNWGSNKVDSINNLLTLDDSELRYSAKFYKTSYEKTMREDVSGEYMPFTDVDQELVARLLKMSL